MSIVVVTDSTACLPEMAAAQPLTVVPLHVVMRGVSGREGLEFGPAEVAKALAAHDAVSTSQPTPGEFAAVYRELFEAGADGIVSIHMASGLSGTFSCAQIAAGEVEGEVEVIDSRSTAMGLGFPALAAASAASDGFNISRVRSAAEAAIANTSTFFYVDTLEHLRRGGRITAVSALLGTALAVKPLLEIVDGKIVLRDKVRTAGRALDRLVALVVGAGGDGPVEVAVHHLAARERASYLEGSLRERLGDRIQALHTTEVGAVVAAHAGPGLAGVVVHRL